MAYNHGVRVKEQATSLVAPVTGTAGLQVIIGTAPVNLAADPYKATNVPMIAYSFSEAVEQVGYSDDFKNYTLCQSMDACFRVLNVAPIILINVLDPKKHKKANEEQTVNVEKMQATVKVAGILADTVEVKYQQNLRDKGPDLKIGKDHRLAEYIETKIAEDGYSPGAVLGEIKAKGLEFETEISKPTLYSYIDKGIFLTITNKELPVKGRRKKKNKKVRRQARANAGTSIEKRPEDIDTREEFGHWEMDTVVGKRGESKHSLLVLTERKTRNELIYLLYEHTTEQVCKRLDQLEAEWGERFGQVFKTITVDNGSEFADWEGMQQSAADESEKRVTVFYCHPYCSFERGSNENQNRLVRRKIPKGENFDDWTEDDIQRVEDWINDYPREMFGWKTSGELFQEELARLA